MEAALALSRTRINDNEWESYFDTPDIFVNSAVSVLSHTYCSLFHLSVKLTAGDCELLPTLYLTGIAGSNNVTSHRHQGRITPAAEATDAHAGLCCDELWDGQNHPGSQLGRKRMQFGDDNGKKLNRRKRHLAFDSRGHIVAVRVTAANLPDRRNG